MSQPELGFIRFARLHRLSAARNWDNHVSSSTAFQIATAALNLSQLLIHIGEEVYEFIKEAPHARTRLEDLVKTTRTHHEDLLCIKDVLEAWTEHYRDTQNVRERRLLSTLDDRTKECSDSANLIQSEIDNIKRIAEGKHGRQRLKFIKTALLHWALENNTFIPRFERVIEGQKRAISMLISCLSM
ncbi:hypothetical protein BGZ60DRAFT_429030 [Tricladium varicosporioides]|nr:hypothetical protein BGZ60DRAFT_429030 [Hymenoscyphus varicosporioides]